MIRRITLVTLAYLTMVLAGCARKADYDAQLGTITYPPKEGTRVLDAARDFAMEMDWQSLREAGKTIGQIQEEVSIAAVDGNGAKVTFTTVWIKGERAMLKVTAENGSQFSVAEMTTEIARRLEIAPDAEPLAKNK